ncbi:MAG: hypothetical protein KJO07_15385 [Deltaproteobacteria bacterium]|nr:hypothetical protein [Deltaproteobacteria bacterium]
MSRNWRKLELEHKAATEAHQAAAVLSAELHLSEQLDAYRSLSWSGADRPVPTLHLDDVSAIPFLVDIAGVEEYQHRARVRAGDGDFFAASTPAAAGYEDYCQKALAMGAPTMLIAEPGDNKLAVADACSQGPAYAQLLDGARASGGLTIHPYMGIEDVWQLGAKLSNESGGDLEIIAPPPPVTWIANDKQSFSRLVELVLGDGWLVETHTTTDPDAMARSLRLLAMRHDRVGLKRTRCASAMGNCVYDRAEIAGLGDDEIRAVVEAFLERTEWPEGEEVLAVAWENTDISPSTQLWIPPHGQGQPVLEGIYEQILVGPEKMFLGSRPSGLPAPVNETLARSALEVAAGLQSLGYVGRCSFDHLVIGDPNGEFRAVFVECNGRWGGTSTPMSLLDRLLPDGPRPAYRAQDFVDDRLVGVPLDDILARVGDALFRTDRPGGRYIFYNVGPLAGSGKLDVIAIGETQEAAEQAMTEELPALLFG